MPISFLSSVLWSVRGDRRVFNRYYRYDDLAAKEIIPYSVFPFSFYKTLLLSGAAMTIVLQVFLQIYDTLLDKGMPERELSVLFFRRGMPRCHHLSDCF